jgi:hypothetical protein
MIWFMRGLGVAFYVLAACGDDGDSVRHDSGVTSDSLEIDAAAGAPVSLTVTSYVTELAGVRVYFQNPDSTLVASVLTDASGTASAVMPLGGYVTAVDPFARDTNPSDIVELRTFSGVKPGDSLVLKDPFPGDKLDTTFVVPTDPDGTVTGYLIATPCDDRTVAKPTNGSNPSATMSLGNACSPTTDVLVVTLTTGGAPVHWMYASNVTEVSNTIDLSAMTIDGTPSTKMYSFTNVPAGAGGVSMTQYLATSRGVVIEHGSVNLAGTAPTYSAVFTPFAGALDLIETTLPMDSGLGVHGLYDWGTYGATYTTDVGARLLAEPMTAASFDTTAHQVTWTAGTAGATPDFTLSYVFADRPAASLSIDWRICAPYTAGVLQLPTLPVDGGVDYNLVSSDTVDINRLYLGKVTGGYDAVRPSLLSLNQPQDFAAGASSGTMTLERFAD